MSIRTPLQIGITGGIGSGKSLVSRIFSCLGIPVYDADSHAKALMTTDGILVEQIKKEFGQLSYHGDGSLNRKYISEVVFRNPEKLKKLNNLVHPRVGADYQQWVSRHAESPYVIKEAALMFESGSSNMMDNILMVNAPEELRISRILARDKHRTEANVKDIIRNQMAEEKKLELADFVIQNNEQELIIPQVLHLHQVFIAKGNSKNE